MNLEPGTWNLEPGTGFFMANCPVCNTPGAYIGFNSVECRNPRCVHFAIEEEDICPCCGKKGHTPGPDFIRRRARANSKQSQAPGAVQPSEDADA